MSVLGHDSDSSLCGSSLSCVVLINFPFEMPTVSLYLFTQYAVENTALFSFLWLLCLLCHWVCVQHPTSWSLPSWRTLTPDSVPNACPRFFLSVTSVQNSDHQSLANYWPVRWIIYHHALILVLLRQNLRFYRTICIWCWCVACRSVAYTVTWRFRLCTTFCTIQSIARCGIQTSLMDRRSVGLTPIMISATMQVRVSQSNQNVSLYSASLTGWNQRQL